MNTVPAKAAAPTGGVAAVPKSPFDARPLWVLVALALLALPLVGSPSTWLTLTAAGLAMGLIIFIIA
jgi:branched-chain amino acid transport system permease protein